MYDSRYFQMNMILSPLRWTQALLVRISKYQTVGNISIIFLIIQGKIPLFVQNINIWIFLCIYYILYLNILLQYFDTIAWPFIYMFSRGHSFFILWQLCSWFSYRRMWNLLQFFRWPIFRIIQSSGFCKRHIQCGTFFYSLSYMYRRTM